MFTIFFPLLCVLGLIIVVTILYGFFQLGYHNKGGGWFHIIYIIGWLLLLGISIYCYNNNDINEYDIILYITIPTLIIGGLGYISVLVGSDAYGYSIGGRLVKKGSVGRWL